MYKVGEIYIWHNQVGEFEALNGTETTVLEGPFEGVWKVNSETRVGWLTDSYAPNEPLIYKNRLIAFVGDLRPKYPPSGEQKILELFKITELETA